MNSKKVRADFETKVCGIPCGVVIERYEVYPPFNGPSHMCESDVDYYGYTICEWHLVDRKGYTAVWLETKMRSQDRIDIENEIAEFKRAEVE